MEPDAERFTWNHEPLPKEDPKVVADAFDDLVAIIRNKIILRSQRRVGRDERRYECTPDLDSLLVAQDRMFMHLSSQQMADLEQSVGVALTKAKHRLQSYESRSERIRRTCRSTRLWLSSLCCGYNYTRYLFRQEQHADRKHYKPLMLEEILNVVMRIRTQTETWSQTSECDQNAP